MSSYNNIEKIKYSSEDCVVTLQEYIVFENERAEEKYVVFKFSNNVNQQLLGMEFEVSQFDIDNNLVEKSVVIYNKFLAKPVQSFVPNAKLKVNYACKTLSVRLVQAAFDRFIWKEGQFLDNSYKFEHYAEDEDTEAAKKSVPAAPVKVKAQKQEPAPKKRKGKLPFTAKNSTKKNIAKFPAIFNTIVCLLAMGAMGFAVYDFTSKSDSFTVDDFDVKVMDADAKTVSVIGYDGESKSVTIPAMIEGYTVVRIGENAFKNSDIQSVKFNSTQLYIEGYAFGGCESLKTVSSEATITVHGYAFYNCTALKTVTLPNATFVKNSLIGCKNVTTLEYGSIGANSLEEVFGGKLPSKLDAVNGSKPTPPPDGDFEYDPNETYDYGELQGKGVEGYVWSPYFETVNGTIITVNTELSDEFVIPYGVTAISDKVLSKLARFTSLIVEGNVVITPEVAGAFSNVKSLDISNHESVDESLLSFQNLLALSVPCYIEAPLVEQYSVPEKLSTLVLKPSSTCWVIPANAFDGVNADEIVVEYGFTNCGMNIVSKNDYIQKITLPKDINYGAGVIGSGCGKLATVDVSLQDFTVPYDEFNLSYSVTKNLIISTETLDGFGYLFKIYRNLETVEIHAETATVSLRNFVFGDVYVFTGHPAVKLAIGSAPENFTDDYLGEIFYL